MTVPSGPASGRKRVPGSTKQPHPMMAPTASAQTSAGLIVFLSSFLSDWFSVVLVMACLFRVYVRDRSRPRTCEVWAALLRSRRACGSVPLPSLCKARRPALVRCRSLVPSLREADSGVGWLRKGLRVEGTPFFSPERAAQRSVTGWRKRFVPFTPGRERRALYPAFRRPRARRGGGSGGAGPEPYDWRREEARRRGEAGPG